MHPAMMTLLAVVSVAGAGIVVWTLAWVFGHLFAIPAYDDMFDHARMYRSFHSVREFLAYMVSPHNEHRIFTTRLLSFIDDRFFAGREYTHIVVCNVLQIASAVIAWRVCVGRDGRDGRSDYGFAVALLVAILLLFINPAFLYTLVFPFQVQHAEMAFLCVVAAACVARVSDGNEPATADYTRLFASLIALACVATLTLGNAPVIFISVTAVAIALRWRPTVIAALALLAVAHTAFVLLTTVATGKQSFDLVRIFKFAAIYWGSPFLRFDAWPAGYVTWSAPAYLGALCGVVVFVVGIGYGIARLLKPGLGGSPGAFGLVLLAIVIVTGLAAGHARSQFGLLEGGSKKYASFAALGWLGVLAVVAGLALQREKLGRLRRMGREWLAIVALCILLPFSVAAALHEMPIWQKWQERNWTAALAVFLGINSRADLNSVDYTRSNITQYAAYAQAHRLGVYSYFPFRWGDAAQSLLTQWKPTSCRGEVESQTPISEADQDPLFKDPGTPVTFKGWTWMDHDLAPATTVMAVDGAGRIVGVGRTTQTSARAEEWLGRKFSSDMGWTGFARIVDNSPLKFYALSPSAREYCELGTVGSVR